MPYTELKHVCPDTLKEQETFSIVPVLDYDRLKTSIGKFGILFPLITDRKWSLISGRSRLRAAVELGFSSVPVLIAEGDGIELFTINIVQTFHSGMDPGDAARALCIRKLIQDFGVSDEKLVNDYLPMLGCEKSRKIAEDLKAFSGFSESVLTCFVKSSLSLRAARIFFPYADEDREYVCTELSTLGAGENRFRKVGEWLWHIAQRKDSRPADVLRSAFDELQRNMRPKNIKELEKILSVLRNPVISKRNSRKHAQ